LQSGGLIDSSSNPGAATPESLYRLYSTRAATTANPYLLRQASVQKQLTTNSVVTERVYEPPKLQPPRQQQPSQQQQQFRASPPGSQHSCVYSAVGSSSGLKVLSPGDAIRSPTPAPLGLTLNSLTFNKHR
jgi:hypothetical protein